ncbi:MAG: orotidine-5'-phosphate decarboxylase [Bdellovibrionota bacterium]
MKTPTELIVALDMPRPDKAMRFVDVLDDLPVIFKVGFELFLGGGHEVVRELVHRKKRVFLDLKFHDIPNTVARASKLATLMHVEMFSVHLAGGSMMVKAIRDVLSETSSISPKLLGVTVLTSFDDVRWAEVTKAMTGHAVETSDSVLGLAEHAVSWGVDGLICSALELPLIRKRLPKVFVVVPGIRLVASGTDDQARVMTPEMARKGGADAIVVGRPIIESNDPRLSTESILKQLAD